MSDDEIKLEYYLHFKQSGLIDLNETLTQTLASSMLLIHKRIVNLEPTKISESIYCACKDPTTEMGYGGLECGNCDKPVD